MGLRIYYGTFAFGGKGIAYEALHFSQIADALQAAIARKDYISRLNRFHEYVGYLVSCYLVSPSDSPEWLKNPRQAVAELMHTLS